MSRTPVYPQFMSKILCRQWNASEHDFGRNIASGRVEPRFVGKKRPRNKTAVIIHFVAWNMSLLGQGNLYGVKEDRAEFKRLIAYPLYNSVGEKLKLD